MEHLIAAAAGGAVSLLFMAVGWRAGSRPTPQAPRPVGPVTLTLAVDNADPSTDRAVRELEAMIRRLDAAPGR